METIGQRIKRLRYEQGYKRGIEFAPLVQMTQSSLSDVESKNKEFSAFQLMALCRVLGVTPEHLLYGSEKGEEDMSTMEIVHIYKSLSPEKQETLLTLGRALAPSQANRTAA